MQKSLFCSLFLTTIFIYELHGDETSTLPQIIYELHEDKAGDEMSTLPPISYELHEDKAEDETSTPPSTTCGETPRPMRITMRHIEGHGVGYNRGYSTLEGFFARAPSSDTSWVPFLDLRGHMFDNRKFAANAGLGIRYLSSSRVWGINSYYDYRQTNHSTYKQVSLGLESLGQIWDFRINGYLPFGKKQSSHFHTKFEGFKGHHMFLSRKREFGMNGANAEIGAHITKMKYATLYAAAGPYYLNGKGKSTWGGEGRLALDITDYVRLEGNASYDHIFKRIYQGQFSLIFPFGEKKQIKRKEGRSCSRQIALSKRAVQRVDRNEIIVVDKKKTKSIAINPVTGLPYFFIFVDNTSHSDGTFESPFPTLVEAQNASSPNDVIYVFPGDGTDTGMNAGITLQDNQRLLGAGLIYDFPTTTGTVRVPALATGMPLITKTTDVIIAANNNEIAGLHIMLITNAFGSHAILCSNINNAFVYNNVIDTGSSIGLSLQNCSGQIRAINNTFVNPTNDSVFMVQLRSSAPGTSYLFLNNSFISSDSGFTTGFELGVHNNPIGDFGSLNISNNQFMMMGGVIIGKAIGGFGFGGIGNVIIDQNTFTLTNAHIGPNDHGFVSIQVQDNGNIGLSVTNNVWENSLDVSKPAFYLLNVANTSVSRITLTGNTSDSTPVAYNLDNSIGGGASMTTVVSDNIGTVVQTGTTPGP